MNIRFELNAICTASSTNIAASFVYPINETSIEPTNSDTPYPNDTPQNAVIIPNIGFLLLIKYTNATNGINIAYPTSLINEDTIAINITINVSIGFETLLKCLLVNVSINPVPSAIVIPINDNNNIPNGPKLKKFFEALLIINLIPSNDTDSVEYSGG